MTFGALSSPPWKAGGERSASQNSPAAALRQARKQAERFTQYQTNPLGYLQDILNIHPWKGRNGKRGQYELVQDIGESVRRQLEGDEYAPKIFRVDSAHGVGKTYIGAGLVNWFFDAFTPGITITTAPTKDQVELLLWKDIKSQRKGRGLPGRVLPETPRMVKAENHWAIGRTTSDAGGQGTARAQGQHAKFMFFVVDEAEGVPAYQFDAINAMMTGGVVMIWLLIANPQTRTSAFHKLGKQPGVQNYQFSLLDFPNVVEGVDVVPGGTSRAWLNKMVAKHCDPVLAHDPDRLTFQLDWDVLVEGEDTVFPAGMIFAPNAEFQFRALGVPPAANAGDAMISTARFEQAVARVPDPEADRHMAQIGVDAARFGSDAGNVWLYHGRVLTREAELRQVDDFMYAAEMKRAALKAIRAGAKTVSFRVDGTGGYGGGKIDIAKADAELHEAAQAAGCTLVFHEVQFNHVPHDPERYYDRATELYGTSNDQLLVASIPNPPEHLQADLTERRTRFMAKNAGEHRRIVRKLESKDDFKARVRPARSPDDGDGAALSLADEVIFTPPPQDTPQVTLSDLSNIRNAFNRRLKGR
ncbi:hypothetical protein DEIGR_400025 [Deinococcus grandis]|uniref:Uncharacterized protein n=1 Tax=Deinococcus grandis TaxID=57498 RepID=A0A117DPS4_9DEIO|nr:hypothetical protein [Deinococcus grandis]GAQ23892.1 hypothetical protein DEIGR_400025 [Deinococcus grandis]